jgi:hypothetical protein
LRHGNTLGLKNGATMETDRSGKNGNYTELQIVAIAVAALPACSWRRAAAHAAAHEIPGLKRSQSTFWRPWIAKGVRKSS